MSTVDDIDLTDDWSGFDRSAPAERPPLFTPRPARERPPKWRELAVTLVTCALAAREFVRMAAIPLAVVGSMVVLIYTLSTAGMQ